ncbi:hypothetical protein [Actinoplanes nipponensis]|uniref:hypothetical protein n=1 Tax=Actinoplanes nipponensis TaxID=135950 RepID=UPI0031EAECD8
MTIDDRVEGLSVRARLAVDAASTGVVDIDGLQRPFESVQQIPATLTCVAASDDPRRRSGVRHGGWFL